MYESRLSHDFIYKSTSAERKAATNRKFKKELKENPWEIEETASNVLMLSHYYFFCSFCAQKYVHNFCVYIRFFQGKERSGTSTRRRGGKSTIKKSFSPFSIYSEPPCMYWKILYVIRSVRKKKNHRRRRKKKKKRIISYKHEAWKEEGKNHLRCEEKCNEEISRFFSVFKFVCYIMCGRIKKTFYFLVDARARSLLARSFASCCCSAFFYGYFLCYVCL